MHLTSPESALAITVKGDNDLFTYPLDCTGVDAYVEGVFHVESDKYTMSIAATGVTLNSEKRTICREWKNQASIQDMDAGEFEFPGMGSGLVTLEPGKMMHLHSTNHSTEIVTVFEGTVDFVFVRGDVEEKHVLKKHEAIMVPHSTPHYVANNGAVPAVYLFVHAMVPVPPPED